ncbi:prolyl oligopeptidase family serine peptidase [Leeia sp. TBRC 13508]|uniref:Prolyl oligopeptidase family serine peptidase n=1 Tax=Leeia speluncae TaxID=2884804 RepID=A0ABS8D8M8_9NEIS|nr:alpha/beta hydrolase-fold protein [Leeia speluncae]MCB6184576.1 prolyl oligopeptidase family serine peptidase [Leeia speluncae]
MTRQRKILSFGVRKLMALSLLAFATGTTVFAEANWAPITLLASKQYDFTAKVNGTQYRIFASIPSTPAPSEGYPVLYVLDGNAAFPIAAFIARGIESRHEVTGITPPIIIGIGYPSAKDFDIEHRAKDYTPAATGQTIPYDHGGADAFFQFIQTELKPLVASQFAINPKKQAIFGHSFGGLFVSYACVTHPESFSTCLASSPSLWWGDQQLVKQLSAANFASQTDLPSFQITVGALEDDLPKGSYPADVIAELKKRSMILPAKAFAARLQEISSQTDRVRFEVLEKEDHGFVWLPALSRGIEFFLMQASEK